MKATYKGPGDAVELDGLRVEKGKATELDFEQITRIRAAGGEVDIAADKPARKAD
jgi:hypothetical protein